jgi:hypothetical protein
MFTASSDLGCYRCGKTLTVLDYGRADRCRGCGFDTRVCKNCIHYDPAAYNECREPNADRVVDKEKAIFCDYFKPGKGGAGGGKSAADMKAAADALFKKK